LLIIGLSIPDRLKARRESFQSTKEF
ncbi:TPA: sialic acid transporter, partial [Salmonella enterica subsp. enterica serovar Indiana]|nr:sialic acid transporter [Salmonella enterica subsp. enterica serovar Indiana]